MTDGECVRRAALGDSTSLSELAHSWSGSAYAFCLARCRNRHLAEDLAQESMLRALKNLASLKDPDRFGPWLRGIALRVYLDWRKARQTSQVPFSTLGATDAIEDLLAPRDDSSTDREENVEWLLSEVDRLDNDLRETILLYYSHAMTYSELAELLEVSPGTINLRLTKARTILRSRAASRCDSGRTVHADTVQADAAWRKPATAAGQAPVASGAGRVVRSVHPEGPPESLAAHYVQEKQP